MFFYAFTQLSRINFYSKETEFYKTAAFTNFMQNKYVILQLPPLQT